MRTRTCDDNELASLVEEITGRIQAGEQVDCERLARDYPAYRDELRDLIPTLQTLANLGDVAVSPSSTNGIPNAVHGVLGDFRLIREIGRGGMGIVYEAEQLSMQRRVALKILPFATLIGRNALLRFRNEVQAAATLDHPHIVSVYCVGEERGVHYYAMQLVRGQSLAAVIRQLRAASGERVLDGSSLSEAVTTSLPTGTAEDGDQPASQNLPSNSQPALETHNATSLPTRRSDTTREYCLSAARLVMQAAGALQHAHKHGVVHRDIKPANLMLDSDNRIWITDFGLARTETDTGITRSHDMIGTLRYMSPEQVRGDQAVVDHRTDIYSLGATLYELLTLERVCPGTDRQELARKIALVDPVNPRARNRKVPVELEIITLKTLEKQPEDRYQTAQELADDLRRLLNDEPIRAQRPSLFDRFGKWAKRHRSLVSAVAISLLLLTIGLSASTFVLVRKQSQLVAERNHAARQQQRAEKAETTAKAINRFLTEDVLAQADPARNAVGDQVTLLQVVDQAANKIDTAFTNQPEVRAALHRTLADTYRALGQYEKSVRHYRAALDTKNLGSSNRSLEKVELLNQLGWVLKEIGRFGEAEKVLTLSLETGQNELGLDDSRVLDAIVNLYELEKQQEKNVGIDVKECFQKHIAAVRRVFGEDHPATLRANYEWAWMLHQSGEHAEAEALLRQVVVGRRRILGPDDPDTLEAASRLGLVLLGQRKFTEAAAVMRTTLEAKRRALGADDQRTLDETSNLGAVLAFQGKYEEAEVHFRTTLEARQQSLGPDHPETLDAMNNLGWLLMVRNRLDEAEDLFRTNWQKIRDKRGPNHDSAIITGTCLGFLLLHQGKYRQAEEVGRKNLAAARQSLGPEHTTRGGAVVLLASVLCAQGRRVAADDLFTAEMGAILVSKSDESADSRLMSSCFLNAGDLEDAVEWAHNAVEEIRKKSPQQPPIALATSLAVYARALLANRNNEEAEAAVRECLTIRKAALPTGHWLTAQAEFLLGRCLAARDNLEEAESLFAKSSPLIDAAPDVSARQRIGVLESLVAFNQTRQKQDKVRTFATRLGKKWGGVHFWRLTGQAGQFTRTRQRHSHRDPLICGLG